MSAVTSSYPIRKVHRFAVRSVGMLITAWLGVTPTFTSAEQTETNPNPVIRTTGRVELEALYARWETIPRNELRKAAEAGDAEAQFYWGDTEFDGAYKDLNKAQQWLNISMGAGTVDFGRWQSLTDREKQDAKARWSGASDEELERAAEAHDRSAAYYLGQKKTGAAFERARSGFDHVLRAAKQGLLPAQHFAGIQLIGSIWWHAIPNNLPEGMKWLEQAARSGYEPSQHKLAEVKIAKGPDSLEFGQGIDWLQQAADHGCRVAQYELARHYERGEGEPRNEGESAVALLRRASLQGLPEASLALAKRHRTGLGVAQDYIAAILAYRKAYSMAQKFERFNPAEPPTTVITLRTENDEVMELVAAYLGLLAPDGSIDSNRPSPDAKFTQVFSDYVRGEDYGDPEALAILAKYHAKGFNTARNLKFAYIYYALSAERGNGGAAAERDKLRSQLSQEELGDAKMRIERYNKWHPNGQPQPTDD